jgi:hypothetical protein
MSNQFFNACYLRIFDTRPQVCGAGIYIGENLALTCAHVVATGINLRDSRIIDENIDLWLLWKYWFENR